MAGSMKSGVRYDWRIAVVFGLNERWNTSNTLEFGVKTSKRKLWNRFGVVIHIEILFWGASVRLKVGFF